MQLKLTGLWASNILKEFVWWILLIICITYGVYGFYKAGLEVGAILGLLERPLRAAPIVFAIHAISGCIALIAVPLQVNARLRSKYRKMHTITGRFYVTNIWITSIAGLWVTIVFGESIWVKFAFGSGVILLFFTTTAGYFSIRGKSVLRHREWMIRSFSLCLFFVAFSFWVPMLAGASISRNISYPLAIFLSWALNLCIAEIWIRITRRA